MHMRGVFPNNTSVSEVPVVYGRRNVQESNGTTTICDAKLQIKKISQTSTSQNVRGSGIH